MRVRVATPAYRPMFWRKKMRHFDRPFIIRTISGNCEGANVHLYNTVQTGSVQSTRDRWNRLGIHVQQHKPPTYDIIYLFMPQLFTANYTCIMQRTHVQCARTYVQCNTLVYTHAHTHARTRAYTLT